MRGGCEVYIYLFVEKFGILKFSIGFTPSDKMYTGDHGGSSGFGKNVQVL